MGGAVDKVVKVGSFGLVDDFSGTQAAQDAAMQAAGLQAGAASEAEAGIQSRFDTTQAMLQPQVAAGDLARQQQLAMLGLSGVDAQQAAMSSLQESPAQQFLRERGEKALLRNSAAVGGLGGGNVLSALQQQGIGFAQQDIENQFSRLGGLSGAGGQAASNIGQLGGQAAGLAANAIQQRGAAQASGILGAQQAQAQGNQQMLQLGGAAVGGFFGGPAGATAGASLF